MIRLGWWSLGCALSLWPVSVAAPSSSHFSSQQGAVKATQDLPTLRQARLAPRSSHISYLFARLSHALATRPARHERRAGASQHGTRGRSDSRCSSCERPWSCLGAGEGRGNSVAALHALTTRAAGDQRCAGAEADGAGSHGCKRRV